MAVIFKSITMVLLIVPFISFASESGSVHWGYEGASGPENWGRLSESYRLCGSGKNQSPVNINWSAQADIDQIQFHYKQSPVAVINNGHTIQMSFQPGSYSVIGGVRFELLQLHFHTLSEHQVSGKYFPLEMHLVHQNAEKQLAVVGVLFKLGDQNGALKKIWDLMPTTEGKTVAGDSTLNAEALLPENRAYFHYMGSLTTPPCSEGVRWLVLKTPVEFGESQLAAFKRLFHANFRPVLLLNKRNIYTSNH